MGGGGQQSSKQSSSYGYGYALSDMFSQSDASSSVWGAQAPHLQRGYNQANQLMTGQQGQVAGRANNIYNQARASNGTGQYRLQQQAKGNLQSNRFTNPNNYNTNQQLDALDTRMSNMWNDTVMPGLGVDAIASGGGMSSGRGQIASGLAAGRFADAYQQGASSIMNNSYNQAANSAAMVDQTMQSAAMAMPGYNQQLMNFGMQPFQAAWAPLQNYMSLLGGPTTLNQSQSTSQASQTSENLTSATSSGKSSSWQVRLI